MLNLKKNFVRILSLGVYPEMGESKKLAIQLATFDGLWTMVTMVFFFFFNLSGHEGPLTSIVSVSFIPMTLGLWLLHKKRHDLGRYILYFTSLIQIFLAADACGEHSGYEFYYFTSVTVPFITFTLEEKYKGIVLSLIGAVVFAAQLILGTRHFMPPVSIPEADKVLIVIMVVIFMLGILAVARLQVNEAQKEIERQYSNLIHDSNLRSLGEMAVGIAHEINNPLQSLILNAQILRHRMEANAEPIETMMHHLDTIDGTVHRISKMIKGMSDLSRNASNDPAIFFYMKDVVENVLSISNERIKLLGIDVQFTNTSVGQVKGHPVYVSQVLINLLNNSIDALDKLSDKWIKIELSEHHGFVSMYVIDSGKGIPAQISQKIMQPFFTTKEPGKGTGLGLGISKNIIEKTGGKFYYDSEFNNTKFVVKLPLS